MEEKTPQGERAEGAQLHPVTVKRTRIALIAIVAVFLILLGRIFLLQTVSYEHYQQKVLEQLTTESSVNAARGSIYDRNGVVLATNVSTYRVFISPSSIASAQSEHDQAGSNIDLSDLISKNLSELLDVTYEFVLKQTTYTGYLDRTIKKEVSEEDADGVRAFISAYGLERMIYLESTHTRYYPYSTMACHVLGFTGADGEGLYGLERYYDEALAGTDGRYVTARDADGNEMPYSYKEYIEAQNGYHVNTTLDVTVQRALESELKAAYLASGGENRAAGIVMNVNTGDVLGMAVYPDFNLNTPRKLNDESLDKLAASGYEVGSDSYNAMVQALLFDTWKNKAVTDSYIPGSTFKVVTAAMSLEEDVVSLGETYTCSGYHIIGKRKIRCHKTNGHGSLSFKEGIQQSCNPWLMRLGLRLGTDTFYEYLRAFGYLEKTGIDLPGEGSSVVKSKEKFQELDLAIYAFGQNFNVTLLQQITAVSAVANGGYLVTPHLLSSVVDENGTVVRSYSSVPRRQAVSEEVCATVAAILEEGVSGNGGAKNAYVSGYRVAAKTGTSEKKERECPICDSAGVPKEIDGEEKYVCTICSYMGEVDEFEVSEDYVCSTVAFAPAECPEYAVIIMVDEPTRGSLYGSTVAAPYVGNVLETILPYLGVEAVYTGEELEKKAIEIPSVVGWNVSVARKYCESRGITLELVGDESAVIRKQYPAEGTVVESSASRIVVYTNSSAAPETVFVPDLTTGWTAKAAHDMLKQLGLNIRIEGTKNYLSGTGPKIVSQSIPAGDEVPVGTVVEVTLRYVDEKDYDESWDTEE